MPADDAYQGFRAARDHLLRHRGDLQGARDFPRPAAEHFNWALDWFDREAAGNHAIALRVVDLDADGGIGGETALSFAELSDRSDRVAGWLRAQGHCMIAK
jgi:acetyl-CoA synthetase